MSQENLCCILAKNGTSACGGSSTQIIGYENFNIGTFTSTFDGTTETVVVVFVADFCINDLCCFCWFENIFCRIKPSELWFQHLLRFFGQWNDSDSFKPCGFVVAKGRFVTARNIDDKYEVTNRQFKAFVDSDGYRQSEYWQEKFVKDGKALPWPQAVEQFI